MTENYESFMMDDVEEEERNEMNFEVLHPGNPVMTRFQNALTEMLENKLNILQDDIDIRKNEIKNVQKEKDNICQLLYVQNSELHKLEEQLYKCNESTSNMINERHLIKSQLDKDNEIYKVEFSKLENEEKLNKELRNKIDEKSRILHQLRNYEQEEVSNLKIIQQAIKKNEADKIVHLKEKLKQDYLLMKLENEIFKFEILIKEYEKQLTEKGDTLTSLQIIIDSKNTDINEITDDNNRLLKIWKHVVFLIEKQDEEYTILKEKYENIQIWHKEKITELKSFQQSEEKEMFRNEELTFEKNKKEQILRKLQLISNETTNKKELLENEIAGITIMIESTEKSLKDALEVQAEYNHELSEAENKYKKLNTEKYRMEEIILSQLQNEVVTNNVTMKVKDEIYKIKHMLSQEESAQKEMKTKYENSLITLERNIQTLMLNQEALELKRNAIKLKEKEMSDCENELNHLKMQSKKQKDNLTEKLRLLSALQEQFSQNSVVEKITNIKETIKEITNIIEKEKRSWIRKQNEILTIIEKRSEIVTELNSLQEQINVLQEKNYRLDKKIVKAQEEHVNYDKSTRHILNLIQKLNNDCDNQKQYENSLDNESYTIQNKVLEKLKTADEDTSGILNEIDNLKNKKESLEKELLNVQKEDLIWEKKVKLATEMKEHIMKEQSENGDIGNMKNEIHKMEIRYTQLKKAQDSLISDLETCVSKRDRIFDNVLKIDKKEQDIQKENQQKLIRHIDNLRNQNSKLKEKIKVLEEKYVNLFTQKNQICEELKIYETNLETLNQDIEGIEEKIQECHLLKHKNLEVLVRKQRCADFFSKIKSGKIKANYRNELSIEKDFMKHNYLHSDLKEVLENLCTDFPMYYKEVCRIMNILLSQAE